MNLYKILKIFLKYFLTFIPMMRLIDSQFIKRRNNEINYDIYINYFCFNSRTRDETKT
jgi:hypothetical protein